MIIKGTTTLRKFWCMYINCKQGGGAKVSCILCHWGVQVILAYSWARPAILVTGKGRGGMFLFLLFLPFHSCFSFFFSLFLSFISSTISSISFLPFSGRWLKMTHKGWHVIKPQHNQSFVNNQPKNHEILWTTHSIGPDENAFCAG